ncbi:hypothetical protein GIB67_003136 [Kingdonia uniflora]|uniref:Uncharacterized protein n=1 Tax=Kingdonia uniflora TaxID=39325 RepID=A0A7J7N6D4_9MAGN|nr:hypothetical protein GIB67_003136 [Kingdonia uniflora]
MYHGWVSGRGSEGLKVRSIEITGKVGNVLVQTSCSEDEFERTLEGEAFVRIVTIAFVIGAIRLLRSDFDWEKGCAIWVLPGCAEGEIGDVDGCRVECVVYIQHCAPRFGLERDDVRRVGL